MVFLEFVYLFVVDVVFFFMLIEYFLLGCEYFVEIVVYEDYFVVVICW